uniref:Uncharacterized protein n=1 Tax=Esox lucius TaxID=8010 RepID=A0AAY5KZC0_ESOLU
MPGSPASLLLPRFSPPASHLGSDLCGLQRYQGGGQPNPRARCPASPTSPPMSLRTFSTQEDRSLMEEGASLESDYRTSVTLLEINALKTTNKTAIKN